MTVGMRTMGRGKLKVKRGKVKGFGSDNPLASLSPLSGGQNKGDSYFLDPC